MPKREKVPATSGQIGEIAGALIGEMNFSKTEATAILSSLGPFRKGVREFYAQYRFTERFNAVPDMHRWGGVYEKLFGKIPDFSTLHIPDKPEGVGPVRLIVVAHELMEWTEGKLQGTQNALKEHFPTCQYEDNLDAAIVKNDRDPQNGSYAVWVRDVREADAAYANMSASDLSAQVGQWISTLERQLMEADYFWERGEHLDLQNVTLCAGSRYRGGGVPRAGWDGGMFGVRWYDVACRSQRRRARRVWA